MICDFGLSRFHHDVTRLETNTTAGGVQHYLAPELYNILADESTTKTKFRSTQKTDIFSIAAIFYDLARSKDSKARSEPFRFGTRPLRPQEFRQNSLTSWQIEVLWLLIESMWSDDPKARRSADWVERRMYEARPPVLASITFVSGRSFRFEVSLFSSSKEFFPIFTLFLLQIDTVAPDITPTPLCCLSHPRPSTRRTNHNYDLGLPNFFRAPTKRNPLISFQHICFSTAYKSYTN